jgi:hypothetical protein
MYYILDLEQTPPEKLSNVEFENKFDACEWIEQNGGIVKYTITEI